MPADVKETFFFETETLPDLVEYQQKFGIDPSASFMEISPSYFASDNARRNIAALFPDAKIVITLRDPVDRAVSAVRHVQRIGFLERDADPGTFTGNKHIMNILDGSAYRKHVLAWSRAFPGRVLQIKQDDSGTYREDAIAVLSSFVETDLSHNSFKSVRSNPARVARSSALVLVSRYVRDFARNRGMLSVIRRLKPLERYLFKSAPDDTNIAPLRAFLAERLEDEVVYFRNAPLFEHPKAP